MEKKPTVFTYNGDAVIIFPGNYFRKEELILRLKQMKFLSVELPYNKSHLINLYDIAINYDENKLKIFNKLKNDTKIYNSRNNLQKNIVNKETHNNNISNNSNKTKYFFSEGNKVEKTTIDNNNDENKDDFSSSIYRPNESSSFCRKLLKFLNNHKMDIIEKLILLFLIFSADSYLKRFCENHLILGRLLMRVRNIITPKRIILAFLLYYILRYILNMFFYYLFGFGILTLLFLIFKDKIREFIFNA